MKSIAQTIVIHAFAIYITSLIFKGLKIFGGIESFLVAGVILTVGDYIVRPVLITISLPFQFVTFGLFSFVVNAIILYISTLLYNKIQISSFRFDGINFSGFKIPAFDVNIFLSYFIISATIYILSKLIAWFFNK